MTTLYINPFNSKCSCGANVLGWTEDTHCTTKVSRFGYKQKPCGKAFTHVSSHYTVTRHEAEAIIAARPDLIWVSPNPDFEDIRAEVLSD